MNNGHGGCGSAPEAALLPIACLEDEVGTQATLARAVAYAAIPTCEDPTASEAEGADVISCSLGLEGEWVIGQTLKLAIEFAVKKGRGGRGCPILWAVSNESVPIDKDEVCSHPDIIAVGKSNRNGRAVGGAYGPKLEFLAPGQSVYSATPQGSSDFGSGTSFAAPLVAGVAALVLSRYPDLTARQVRQRLIDSCEKIGGAGVVYVNGHNDRYGYGLINASKAVL